MYVGKYGGSISRIYSSLAGTPICQQGRGCFFYIRLKIEDTSDWCSVLLNEAENGSVEESLPVKLKWKEILATHCCPGLGHTELSAAPELIRLCLVPKTFVFYNKRASLDRYIKY
jgi:hypothetical protein